MKIVLILLLFAWKVPDAAAQRCSRPVVIRRQAYIYRNVPTKVKVLRCLYNDTKNTYSDITNNCLTAFKTYTFKDKYDHVFNLRGPKAPIVLEAYTADADKFKNEIYLRSGTKCSYDRGFCFDPKETLTYAAVWDVEPIPKEICPAKWNQIFYGPVDVWNFVPEKRHYLFYYTQNSDKAFALKLAKSLTCHNKPVWFTEEKGYIVYLVNIDKNTVQKEVIDPKRIPAIRSKSVIAEAILKDCDLKSFSPDFDTQIFASYFTDAENVKTVFRLHQNDISTNKQLITQVKTEVFKIEAYLKKQEVAIKKEFSYTNVSISSLTGNVRDLSKSSKEFEKLAQKFSSEKIFTKIESVEKRFKDLESAIRMVEQNSAKMSKISTYSQIEVDKKFFNINKNISDVIKNQILNLSNVNSALEKSILNQLKPFIETANKNFNSCSKKADDNFNKLKKDFASNNVIYDTKLRKNLEESNVTFQSNFNIIDMKIKTVENAFKSFKSSADRNSKVLDDLKKSIPMSFTLISALDPLKMKLDICFTKTNSLNSNMTILTKEIKTYKSSQENINKALVQSDDLLRKKFSLVENGLKDVTKNYNQFKESYKKFTNTTDNNFKNITKVLENFLRNFNDLQANTVAIVSKTVDPLFDTVNKKIKTCLDKTERVKTETETSYNDLKHKLSQELDKYSKTLSDKIGKTISSMKNLDTKLLEYKNESDSNKKNVKTDVDNLKHNIVSVDNSLGKRLSSLEIEISSKVNPTLKSTTKDVNSCKDSVNKFRNDYLNLLGDIKEVTFKNITAESKNLTTQITDLNNLWAGKLRDSQNAITNEQTKLKSFKKLYEEKTNATTIEVMKIQKDLTNARKTLEDFSRHLENSILNKTNQTMQDLFEKNNECKKDISDFHKSFDQFKKKISEEYLKEHINVEEKIMKLNRTVVKNNDSVRNTISNSFSKIEKMLESLNQSKEMSEAAKNHTKSLAENINKYRQESEKFQMNTGSKLTEVLKNITSLHQRIEVFPANVDEKINKILSSQLVLLKEKCKDYLERLQNLERIMNESVSNLRKEVSHKYITDKDLSTEVTDIKKNFLDKLKSVSSENKRLEIALNKYKIEAETEVINHLNVFNETISAKTRSFWKKLEDLGSSFNVSKSSSEDSIKVVENQLKELKDNNIFTNKIIRNNFQKSVEDEMNKKLNPVLDFLNISSIHSIKHCDELSNNISVEITSFRKKLLQNISVSNHNIIQDFFGLNSTFLAHIKSSAVEVENINKKLEEVDSKTKSLNNISGIVDFNVQLINKNKERIFNLEKSVDNISTNYEQSVKYLRTDMAEANLKIDVNTKQTKALKADLNQLSKISEDTKKGIDRTNKEISDLRDNYDNSRSRIRNCEKIVEELSKNLTAYNSINQNKYDSEINNLRKLLENKNLETNKNFEELLNEKDKEIARIKIEFNETVSGLVTEFKALTEKLDSCCSVPIVY